MCPQRTIATQVRIPLSLFQPISRPSAHIAFGLIDLNTPNTFTTLTQIWDIGMKLSRNLTVYGHRPIISKNPLKFADYYVWMTYAEADIRRRRIGSALHTMFKDGRLGGGGLETVGIWSQNR